MNGLFSEMNGEFFIIIVFVLMFCMVVIVVIRMVLAAYVEAGEVSKLRSVNWWKMLVYFVDVFICWSLGLNGILLMFLNIGNSGCYEMSDVVVKVIFVGFVMEDGLGFDCCLSNVELLWGKLFV